MKLLSPLAVFGWFASAKNTISAKEEGVSPDPQCRSITAEDEPIASADVIVVGSGPGGAGFLYRFVRRRPDLSVIWIEKGPDVIARNWPDDLVAVDGEVMTNIPRKTMTWISGKAWNNFGGGDACNSGGANFLVTDEPYDPVDVFALRNHSNIPPTETSERWSTAFQNSGFQYVTPPPVKLNESNLVSQPSSLRTADGRERLLLANDLRYATENRRVTYVHARAASVIRDGNDSDSVGGRAVGVRGVRIDGDQNEYGGCVSWKASTAVVLAGGVFNSFDLLVESGIGPAEDLQVRDVPEDWRMPNEDVGKDLGDEHAVIFVGAEPVKADPFGAQPRLIAEDTYGSSYEFWTKGLLAWFRFKNTNFDILLGSIIPFRFPKLFTKLNLFLDGCSMWAVGIAGEPLMKLEATPKPRNWTQSVEHYMMYPFQSPFTLIRDKYNYKKNRLGIIVDDSEITATDRMCEAINFTMTGPMTEGGQLQNQAEAGLRTKWRRFKIMILTKLGVTGFVKPNVATLQNANRFAERCNRKMFASYYHYFGGNADVVDSESYQVKGVAGLHVSDGSVLRLLTPGPSSATIMQTGMRVADAVVDGLND